MNKKKIWIVVGAFICVVALVLFWWSRRIDPESLKKQKATLHDIKSLSLAIEGYVTNFSSAPTGKSIEDIKTKVEPSYILKLPIKDGWGNNFLYTHGTGREQHIFSVASPGKDGVFNGWDQKGNYNASTESDLDNDIIVTNLSFVYGPGVKWNQVK